MVTRNRKPAGGPESSQRERPARPTRLHRRSAVQRTSPLHLGFSDETPASPKRGSWGVPLVEVGGEPGGGEAAARIGSQRSLHMLTSRRNDQKDQGLATKVGDGIRQDGVNGNILTPTNHKRRPLPKSPSRIRKISFLLTREQGENRSGMGESTSRGGAGIPARP